MFTELSASNSEGRICRECGFILRNAEWSREAEQLHNAVLHGEPLVDDGSQGHRGMIYN